MWDIRPENRIHQIRSRIAFRVFAIAGMIWSKTGFGITLLRVMQGLTKAIVWFLIITINIFLGFSAVIDFIACRPVSAVWDPDTPGAKCWPGSYVVKYHIFSSSKFCQMVSVSDQFLTFSSFSSVFCFRRYCFCFAPVEDSVGSSNEGEGEDWRRRGYEHGYRVSLSLFRQISMSFKFQFWRLLLFYILLCLTAAVLPTFSSDTDVRCCSAGGIAIVKTVMFPTMLTGDPCMF